MEALFGQQKMNCLISPPMTPMEVGGLLKSFERQLIYFATIRSFMEDLSPGLNV
jgi:hypothetical protein